MNSQSFINPKAKIGKNTVIEAFSYIDDNVIIGSNCLGADNLYFVLSTLIIYICIFRLKEINNLAIIFSLSITTSLAINIIRNTILAILVSSKLNNMKELHALCS